MSAMWYEIQTYLSMGARRMGIPGVDLEEVLYADDTAVIAEVTQAATRVLRAIELNAVHYGMRLDRATCKAMVMGEPGG